MGRVGEGGGAAVQPLPDVDTVLGPGDALDRRGHGIDTTFAGLRQESGCGGKPLAGVGRRSAAPDRDSRPGCAASASPAGFTLLATRGTAEHLEANGVPSPSVVDKLGSDCEGDGMLTALDLIAEGKIAGREHAQVARTTGPTGTTSARRRAAQLDPVPHHGGQSVARHANGVADWAIHGSRARCRSSTLPTTRAEPSDALSPASGACSASSPGGQRPPDPHGGRTSVSAGRSAGAGRVGIAANP